MENLMQAANLAIRGKRNLAPVAGAEPSPLSGHRVGAGSGDFSDS